MKKIKATTEAAAPESNGKDKKNSGIVSIETAKLIHFLFGTPMNKIPIKREEADDENL